MEIPMIPKSKRRTLTIDNTTYEYCVTGYVSIYIKNLSTNETIKWHDEWKHKWKQSVTPKDIEELIRTKSLGGKEAIFDPST